MFSGLQDRGPAGLAYGAYVKLLQQFPWPRETHHIYDEDWDVLVVLDACRPDLFSEVMTDYDFGNNNPAETRYSVGSMTREWMQKSFIPEFDEEIKQTTYVCGNPFSNKLDGTRFTDLLEVWKDGWDDELGTVPPEAVTNHAIQYSRDNDWDRMIVHYLQPHVPFRKDSAREYTKNPGTFGEAEDGRDVWDRFRADEMHIEQVWDWYRDNLVWALDEVAVLLDNLDADNVVLTSDHGNAVGEWHLWGHPARMPVSAVRAVPWLETTANDEGTRTPNLDIQDSADVNIDQRLASLGYLS